MAATVSDGMLSRLPIIVILGATGTGKSKLALQVAKKFNGEIISADAMQVYKGLDIITNKVTPEEVKEVPHHMIDYLDPGEPTRVTDYRDRALPIIEDLLDRQKLPVIAGGTNYYVESLLWKQLMDSEPGPDEPPTKKARVGLEKGGRVGGLGALSYVLSDEGPQSGNGVDMVEQLKPCEKMKLHDALKEVDPERAGELHPNNVRKVIRQRQLDYRPVVSVDDALLEEKESVKFLGIHLDQGLTWDDHMLNGFLRSLQVYDSTGRRHSELLRQQRAEGGHLGGPLRYPSSVVLWVTCNQEVLDGRLDERVDRMIEQGLIAELREFHDQYNLQRVKEEEGGLKTAAYTLGIFQSIGFKEFHDYLMLDETERENKEGRKMFSKGLELMKMATRQYARRQNKWIRQRFLRRNQQQALPLYSLNGTDASQWDGEVRDKAYSIVQAALDGKPSPVPAMQLKPAVPVDQTLHKCDDCERFFMGAEQWDFHLKSSKHKRRLAKLAREAFNNKTVIKLMESGEKNDEHNKT